MKVNKNIGPNADIFAKIQTQNSRHWRHKQTIIVLLFAKKVLNKSFIIALIGVWNQYLSEIMSNEMSDNINELPFKLRFTSTQKLFKELTKMIGDRYEVLDKLIEEYEHIGQHKHILGECVADGHTYRLRSSERLFCESLLSPQICRSNDWIN